MSGQSLAIIDDDAAVRQSLMWLLESEVLQVSGFDSAEQFLAHPGHAGFNCLIIDLRLSGMSGILLLQALAKWPYCPPAIMLTGHGDVPHAVAAFKLGVMDFLEKPFDDVHLIDMVNQCLGKDCEARALHEHQERLHQTLATLTEREREVMQLVLAGLLNKQIAEALSISMKTVEVHRARVFDKMGVKSAVELAGLITTLAAKDSRV